MSRQRCVHTLKEIYRDECSLCSGVLVTPITLPDGKRAYRFRRDPAASARSARGSVTREANRTHAGRTEKYAIPYGYITTADGALLLGIRRIRPEKYPDLTFVPAGSGPKAGFYVSQASIEAHLESKEKS